MMMSPPQRLTPLGRRPRKGAFLFAATRGRPTPLLPRLAALAPLALALRHAYATVFLPFLEPLDEGAPT